MAALTILPNASLVAKAWDKWRVIEGKLQKLRYIRRQKQRLTARQEEYERKDLERKRAHKSRTVIGMDEEEEREKPTNDGKHNKNDDENGVAIDIPSRILNKDGETEVSYSDCIDELGHEVIALSESQIDKLNPSRMQSSRGSLIEFRYEFFDIAEYASSIGFHEEVHEINDLVNGMGIEEFNVFARECADLAGGPGFDLKMYDMYGMDGLREEEKLILGELRSAHLELLKARKNVVMFDTDSVLDPSKPIQQPFAKGIGRRSFGIFNGDPSLNKDIQQLSKQDPVPICRIV